MTNSISTSTSTPRADRPADPTRLVASLLACLTLVACAHDAPKGRTGANAAPSAADLADAGPSSLQGGGAPANGEGVDAGEAEPLPPTLSSQQIGSVVASRKAAVRRACWEAPGYKAVGTVKVNVKVVVAADGQVQSAVGTGTDPILTRCIEGNVRGWRFPLAEGSTPVDIPFSFIHQ